MNTVDRRIQSHATPSPQEERMPRPGLATHTKPCSNTSAFTSYILQQTHLIGRYVPPTTVFLFFSTSVQCLWTLSLNPRSARAPRLTVCSQPNQRKMRAKWRKKRVRRLKRKRRKTRARRYCTPSFYFVTVPLTFFQQVNLSTTSLQKPIGPDSSAPLSASPLL